MAGRALPVFYSPQYVGSQYAFDTTRKAAWVADSLVRSPISGIRLIDPPPLTETDLAAVHAPEFVHAVRTGYPRELAESQGFTWDAGLWPAVLASNGGVVAAAMAALDGGCAGSLSSGMHHSRHDRGAGFCTFNGLVIAARATLGAGAGSVLILDLDAHCGGGTASLIRDEPRITQRDISVVGFDGYVSHDPRICLDLVEESRAYLDIVRRRLEELDGQRAHFDLCLYNAGMDPFEGCSIGGMRGMTRDILFEREQTVFGWCESRALPIAFALAGGYVSPELDEQGLVALHRMTIARAAKVVATPRV